MDKPMIAMFFFLFLPAQAWDSVCHVEDGTNCAAGYETARNRWSPIESEHVTIFSEALSMSGLPVLIAEPFTLRTFALDNTFTGDMTGRDFESVMPVRFGAERMQLREMTPAEFAALPDFSYSLYDWVSGNERCDAYSDTALERCHEFSTHMGALNSSHFLPQAQRFYEYYHLMAMDRALECAQLEDQISAANALASDRFESVYMACEQEALVLEAVGQHYMEDAWSMGHMWERWGGPEIDDHPEGLEAAQVVGATSGIIHGAKAIVPFADDPMCAPHPDVSYLDAATFELDGGAGDLFYDPFLSDTTNLDYVDQHGAMLGCGINGMREVYAQSHQHHGVMEAADAPIADLSRDPLGESCWGQRATNLALATGFQVHTLGVAPNSGVMISNADFANLLADMAPPILHHLGGTEELDPALAAQYRADILMNFSKIQLRAASDPSGTDLAEGDLPPILFDETNGSYERGGLLDGGMPATYIDPPLPWDLSDSLNIPVEILHLGFAEAHTADRCLDVTSAELEGLRTDVEAKAGTDMQMAACGLCAIMAEPLVRVGIDAGDYDVNREPLCGYTEPGAEFIYTDTYNVTGNDASAARQWCGCGGKLAVTTRGTSPGLSLWGRAGLSLDALPAGTSTSTGYVLPTYSSARAIALGGPSGDWAFVASNDGPISAFQLIDGEELELDWDEDSSTTDAGAPAGVNRLVVGASPRQIALLHTARYGLVTSESGLHIFDAENLDDIGLISATDMGLTGTDRVYGVSVTPDDLTAFVTVWGGSVTTPSSETLVFDLTGLIADDAPDPSWLVGSIFTGTGSNNQIVEVNHRGDKVAIVCPDTNQVLVVDATSPYSEVGFYAEDAFLAPSENPIDVAWAPDDSAIYVGYIGGPANSSISTNGTIRRCDIAQPEDCEHAVAVDRTVRSIAVADDNENLIIWVADDSGGLTALPAAYFEPGAATSGINSSGNMDGTGGCLDSATGYAMPCPITASMGQAAGDLITW